MSKVAKTRENILKCLCKKGPTYSFTCKVMAMPGNLILLVDPKEDRPWAETMFCAYSKSNCIKEEKGCLCAQCKYTRKMNWQISTSASQTAENKLNQREGLG